MNSWKTPLSMSSSHHLQCGPLLATPNPDICTTFSSQDSFLRWVDTNLLNVPLFIQAGITCPWAQSSLWSFQKWGRSAMPSPDQGILHVILSQWLTCRMEVTWRMKLNPIAVQFTWRTQQDSSPLHPSAPQFTTVWKHLHAYLEVVVWWTGNMVTRDRFKSRALGLLSHLKLHMSFICVLEFWRKRVQNRLQLQVPWWRLADCCGMNALRIFEILNSLHSPYTFCVYVWMLLWEITSITQK